MHKVAPSILSADFSKLGEEIRMINQSQADWFHVDIMDGVFVPNLSFGFPVMKTLKRLAEKPLDVHLMIVQPDRYLEEFANHGAHILTVHWEAETHLHRTLQRIRSLGMKAGIALNPHTPVSLLHDILHEADVICLMSVNPGFGGQKFISHTFEKIRELHAMRKKKGLKFLIEVDGGVDLQNANELVQAGTDILVAGHTVFASENPRATIERLKFL